MAPVRFSTVDDAVMDIASNIPGPQEGESISDYRARVNERLMQIMLALSQHKRLIEGFIADHSDGRIEPEAQFFNAVRRRFIADEFESR